ncbi:hypothetical protein GCM10023085_64440 [Actinomadura viridis]
MRHLAIVRQRRPVANVFFDSMDGPVAPIGAMLNSRGLPRRQVKEQRCRRGWLAEAKRNMRPHDEDLYDTACARSPRPAELTARAGALGPGQD